MIIPAPNDESYDEGPQPVTLDHSEYLRIRAYINVPPWKCSECGCTMFGRMEYCAYCKLRLGIERKR